MALDKQSALRRIAANIAQHGHHVYVVSGGAMPRFVYSIGLSPRLGAELVLAGGVHYSALGAHQIVNEIAERMRGGASSTQSFALPALGTFTLRSVHPSWSRELLLGALDFYRPKDIRGLQIVPDAEHWTLDVPDMSKRWSLTKAPVWRCLREAWPHQFPEGYTAVTNLAALRGKRVTEAVRWEQDTWELFAGPGPDVTEDQMRVVSLAMLLAADPSLSAVEDLLIGEGLWRDEQELDWHAWVRKNR